MAGKVAVVTGSNKGVGFGIVKELCKRKVGVVYLTARDIQRGQQALEQLRNENCYPEFHQLDISDRNSVKKFADHLKQKHGGIDILINNAGVIPEDINKVIYEQAKRVIDINYKSYFNIQDYFFPILKDNARVVNVSSGCGHLSNIKNKYWIDRLARDDLKIEDINDFIDWFLLSVKNGTLKEEDFATTALLAYRISKIAICALTRIQQREIGRNISINSLHPGFVKTDMTGQSGELTIDQACQAPVYLAYDCDQTLKGKFIWFDKSEKDWTDLNVDWTCRNEEELEKFFKKVGHK